MWSSGRFNRWFGRSPGRMLVWLIAWPLVAAAVVVALLLSGDHSFKVLATAAATLFGAWQAVVYAPRAWRAFLDGD